MDATVGIQQANAVQAAACALVMLSECGEYDVGKGPEVIAYIPSAAVYYYTLQVANAVYSGASTQLAQCAQ